MCHQPYADAKTFLQQLNALILYNDTVVFSKMLYALLRWNMYVSQVLPKQWDL